MCFCKTRQSKVLRAKRDIVVYKIGVEANKAIFTPYFMTKFSYIAGIKNTTDPNFNISHIEEGFHGYINILVTVDNPSGLNAIVQKNDKYRSAIAIYGPFQYTLYLGRFIIPKGSIYCVNESNEIVSNKIIYTGQYASVREVLDINLKEFFNSI